MSFSIYEVSLTKHSFYLPIRISSLDYGTLGSSEEEVIPFPRILIIWSGDGMLCINDHKHEISRGSVFLCAALPRLILQLEPRSPLRGVWIEYRCITNNDSNSLELNYPAPLSRCSISILRLASELEKVWRESQLNAPFRAQQLFIELMVELYQELAAKQQIPSHWIEQTLQYMETHYSENLTREQMADLVNVSPEHFSRTFRKHTGRTFNAYLTLLRIRMAQLRLLTGVPNLNTLALEVGYKEGLYLSRKFKESIGLSPSAYLSKEKRISTLNINHTACLLALGIVPELGVYTSWLEQELSSMKIKIGYKFNPYGHTSLAFYEAIAASNPDIIINYIAAEENKDLLLLAPVLELPFMTMSWREQFYLIADIVNRPMQAEKWCLQYDQWVLNANHLLDGEFGSRGTAIVWEIGTNSAYCFISSHGRGAQILYDDLGFRPPSLLLEQSISLRGYVETVIESIASYPADHIFITALPSFPGGQQRVNQLFRSPQWLKLEAVQNNRVYLLIQPELFCGYDPISSKAQLRELMKALVPHHKFT